MKDERWIKRVTFICDYCGATETREVDMSPPRTATGEMKYLGWSDIAQLVTRTLVTPPDGWFGVTEADSQKIACAKHRTDGTPTIPQPPRPRRGFWRGMYRVPFIPEEPRR